MEHPNSESDLLFLVINFDLVKASWEVHVHHKMNTTNHNREYFKHVRFSSCNCSVIFLLSYTLQISKKYCKYMDSKDIVYVRSISLTGEIWWSFLQYLLSVAWSIIIQGDFYYVLCCYNNYKICWLSFYRNFAKLQTQIESLQKELKGLKSAIKKYIRQFQVSFLIMHKS